MRASDRFLNKEIYIVIEPSDFSNAPALLSYAIQQGLNTFPIVPSLGDKNLTTKRSLSLVNKILSARFRQFPEVPESGCKFKPASAKSPENGFKRKAWIKMKYYNWDWLFKKWMVLSTE